MSSTRTTPGPTQRFAGIYRQFRHVLHEGAKFLIVGLIGIGVTNLVFIPLHGPLGLGPLKSVTIATIVATVVTFLGNRYWSFRHREGAGTAKEGLTFFFLNGIGLLIQYAVLGFSNYALGLTTKIENVIALNLGIGLGTLFRFWSYRKWVWVPPEIRVAQLRRGRHRKGRPQAVAAESGPAVVGPRRPRAADPLGGAGRPWPPEPQGAWPPELERAWPPEPDPGLTRDSRESQRAAGSSAQRTPPHPAGWSAHRWPPVG